MQNKFGIMLIGHAGSGKDVITKYLSDTYEFKQYAFADKFKSILCDHYNLVNPKKSDIIKLGDGTNLTYRELLINYGETVKLIDKNWWIDELINNVNRSSNKFVISDCRYIHEYNYIREKLKNVYIIKIECDEDIREQRLKLRDGNIDMELLNNNEKDIELMTPDIHIDNNKDCNYLYMQLDHVMKMILKKELL